MKKFELTDEYVNHFTDDTENSLCSLVLPHTPHKINSVHEIQWFLDSISTHNRRISEIDISHHSYSPEVLRILLECTGACQNLLVLNCKAIFSEWDSPSDLDTFEELCKLLETSGILHKLNLASNEIPGHSMDFLSSALLYASSLQVLNLSNNKLGLIGANILAEVFTASTKLQLSWLSLENNQLGDSGIIGLASAWPLMKQLKTLNLSRNSISDSGLEVFASSLPSKVASLDLHDNHFNGQRSRQALSTIIRELRKLQKLQLSDCMIGDRGAKRVLNTLCTYNVPLKFLNLAYNDIGSDSICALVETYVQQVPQLKKIDLSGNDFNLSYLQKFNKKITRKPIVVEDQPELESPDSRYHLNLRQCKDVLDFVYFI